MKLLLVHNSYGSSAPSGENQVFERERDMLCKAGYKVEAVVVSNDEIYSGMPARILVDALRVPWSPRGRKAVLRAVKYFRPDVIHIHNTFPLLSPSVFYAAAAIDSKPAVVMTAHNYRMFCAAGNCMRKGVLCTKCIDSGNSRYAIFNSCYRGGRLSSIPVAAMIGLHNALGTYRRRVDAMAVQTEFQREILLKTGFSPKKIVVIPHCVIPPLKPLPWEERENRVAFIGRLSPEKGLDMLLHAWGKINRDDFELIIIGAGKQEAQYRAFCRERGFSDRVRFLGFVSESEKWSQLSKCKLLVMPTQWYETFGLVFAEAFSVAVPSLASNLGCVPWVVKNGVEGVLVEPTDLNQWTGSLQRLLSNESILKSMSERCYARYLTEYSADRHVGRLEDIYECALKNRTATISPSQCQYQGAQVP
jgi:glycosyltransferase involved in cell wall biosynthesis